MKRALKTEGRSFQTYLALAVFFTDFFFLGIRTVSPLPKPTVSPAVFLLGNGAAFLGNGALGMLATFFLR